MHCAEARRGAFEPKNRRAQIIEEQMTTLIVGQHRLAGPLLAALSQTLPQGSVRLHLARAVL